MPTFQTGAAEKGRGFKPFPDGTVGARKQTYTLAAGVAQNDVIEMIPVFEGETVLDVILVNDALGASVTASVGDGDDPDLYLTATSITSAGVTKGQPTSAANFPKTYAADDTIDVLLEGGNPGTGDITLIVLVV